MVLSVFVKYLCIHLCHKCKVEYIELRVMKVVLIRVIIRKKNSIQRVSRKKMKEQHMYSLSSQPLILI